MTTVQEHLQKIGILKTTSPVCGGSIVNKEHDQEPIIRVYFSNCYNQAKNGEYSGPKNWFQVCLDDEYDNDCWCILTVELADGEVWFTPIYNLHTGVSNYKFNINPSHLQLKNDGDW